MLENLSRTPDKVFYVITKSPPEQQYSNSKIKIKEVSDGVKRKRKCYLSF